MVSLVPIIRYPYMSGRVKFITLTIWFFSYGGGFLHSQTTYFNTQDGLFRFTGGAGTCTRIAVNNPCGIENNYLSLAIYKDTIYYNTFAGDLKRFVLGVPGSCKTLITNGSADNSMTVDKDGIIYFASRHLKRYDPHLNILTDLGLMPFSSAGDLIFYKDKLLLAGFDPNGLAPGIYEIDINNVAASSLYMPTPSFVGLISFPVPCSNSRYFGIIDPQNGTGSQLLEIDLVGKTIIGNSCSMPLEILDAASTTETGIDDDVTFTNIQITKLCQATLANIQATATYPTGVITYTLDNNITNTNGTFLNVSEGQHTIIAKANNGACTNDTTFVVPPSGNLISGVAITNPGNCGITKGSVVITGTSANPPITYILVNSGLNQPTGAFADLDGGTYHFRVSDANGCAKDTTVQLSSGATTLVKKIEVSPATCNVNNGRIDITLFDGNTTAVSSINNSAFLPQLAYTQLAPGTYTIQVKNGSSCSFDTTVIIVADNSRLACTDIYVPTAFTPNGDGKNDLFVPFFPPSVTNIVLRVFNRWGEKVYEGKGNSVSWDGIFDGKKQPPGVYIYHLSFIDGTSGHKDLKGTIVLIR